MREFLATVPIFRELTEEQLREVAGACRVERFPAGASILKQGGYSQALYFLRSGRVAVNVRRGGGIETVAYLDPPNVVGELSFITGRQCSADVDVLVDAECIVLPKEAVPRITNREALLRGMMNVLAERLHDTTTRGARVAASPVVLLRSFPNWEAPYAFATELARSLARQSGQQTLVVHLGEEAAEDLHELADGAWRCRMTAARPEILREETARRLTEWKKRFTNVVLNPVGAEAGRIASQIAPFADTNGALLGPGDPVEASEAPNRFRVQSAVLPSLPVLDGRSQLIQEAAKSENALLGGGSVTEKFRRTVDSIARAILGIQVGAALGGGAAWGWAHIGVLEVLEKNGMPVDFMSGCSMGSVIGAFRAAGYSIAELHELADYWRTRTGRFIEWRFWRMCLLNDKVVRKTFQRYFGDRKVNQVDIPYWANAVDIKTGKEFTIQDGTLVDCVRASISLPGLLSPVARGEHLLVDAGIMDPVPVNLANRMGARFTIAVNAMAKMEEQEINPRYPFNAIDIMLRCTRVMGHEIGQARAEESADAVLTLPLGKITMLEFGRTSDIIAVGRRAAEEGMAAIRAGYEGLKARQLAQAPALPAEPRL